MIPVTERCVHPTPPRPDRTPRTAGCSGREGGPHPIKGKWWMFRKGVPAASDEKEHKSPHVRTRSQTSSTVSLGSAWTRFTEPSDIRTRTVNCRKRRARAHEYTHEYPHSRTRTRAQTHTAAVGQGRSQPIRLAWGRSHRFIYLFSYGIS